MSIPPLVCSTPPPPDQCEDVMDPEYFDISYNLSQEDEDDDDDDNNSYRYGNFTQYNNFQSATDRNCHEHEEQDVIKNFSFNPPNETVLKYENTEELKHHITSTEDHNIIEEKLKCEDDVNIEDLNLKVDKDINNIVEQNEDIEQNANIVVSKANIPSNLSNDTDTIIPPMNEYSIESTYETPKELNLDSVVSNPELSTDLRMDADCEDNYSTHIDLQDNNVSTVNELPNSVKLKDIVNSIDKEDIEPFSKDIDIKLQENAMTDDDFGDFDDFQSVNIGNKITSVVENSDNPWENSVSNESDFSNFTANFEGTEFHSANLTPVDTAPVTLSSDIKDKAVEGLSDDDDFGDFDDFQSSAIKTQPSEITEILQSDEIPVLNLQSTENEHQILERIAKVLGSVFLEEISDPEERFEGKLESLLSETWGHLMETDERQPYIVNWNNSFGQKSLLRALCIDSRNILFGPKWSSYMPKYAANLSNAPLQPQKQAPSPSSVLTQNETVTEKPSNKSTSWGDPFTSDGQESCNTENESAAISPVPTDLNVFGAATTTKSEKIFSNTIGVQPLRQINLPDTHIFTPTDSEIPRSKTIHYDLSPTVLLPQTVLEGNKNETDIRTTNISDNIAENNNDIENSEYWEFQNFKGSPDISSLPNNSGVISLGKNCETTTMVNALPQPSMAYQTELLQPIKIEPAVPALNWPDPGEVKDVFDDFSDFVSISSQPLQKQDNNSTSVEFQMGIDNNKADVSTLDRALPEPVATVKNPDNDGFDDDFDKFQSALPSKIKDDNLDNSSLRNTSQVAPSNLFNITSKVDSFKSDSISFTNVHRPHEALTQNVGHVNKTELTTNKPFTSLASDIQSNVLQPTPASLSAITTQNQQKSGQILQPLSLESYSQINWPSPGIDLQDLSRFNPVETVHSLKSDFSVTNTNKGASPAHTNQVPDDDVWGEFVSSKPKQPLPLQTKKPSTFVDDDEWTDFISSPSVKPQNGLNTISLNVHTNSNIHKSVHSKFVKKPNQPPIDIPTLNYITPKSNPHKSYNDKHFQNL